MNQSAKKPELRLCQSKQKIIICVLFAGFTAEKCKPRNCKYIIVLCSVVWGVYSLEVSVFPGEAERQVVFKES